MSFMGTAGEARQTLIDKARAWRALRQPLMAPRREQQKQEAAEREARFQLANAAVHWLWHEERRLSDPVRGELVEALTSLRALVREGGVPRYTVTPGAALNAVIEEVVDPAIRRAKAEGSPTSSPAREAGRTSNPVVKEK